MSEQVPVQMSDTFRVAALLATVGGFLDAFTFLCHGKVFANAQTGNIVLLGISLAEGHLSGACRYLLPILAFVAGILMSERLKARGAHWQRIHWRQLLLGAEILVLAACAFPCAGEADGWVNTAVSFVCALQVQGFRKVRGNALSTTMCTGNLRTAAESLLAWSVRHDPAVLRRSGHTAGVILCFIAGAVLGVWCARLWEGHALWVPVTLLAAVILFLRRRHIV